MPEFIAKHKERYMRFTKDILGKDVIDSHGFWFGRVEDIVFNNTEFGGFPLVEGLISKKKFIKWNDIAYLDSRILLNKRIFMMQTEPLSMDKMLLGRHLLDEQLVNHEDKHIGRVDDLAFMYDNYEKALKLVGICSGAHLRMGVERNYDVIPWSCVDRIRFERPKAVILKLFNKKTISLSNKVMIYSIANDYKK